MLEAARAPCARRGTFHEEQPEDLLAHALMGPVGHAGLDLEEIEEP